MSQSRIGNTIRVKIGPWEYDATVSHVNGDGKVTQVHYRPKKGSVKIASNFTIV